MSENLKITVTQLITIFRGALLAIIPWIEKAKIKWKEGEAYDDWDNIAESLYKNIVCSSLTGDVSSEYIIARYNFNYEDYSTMDFIEVQPKDNSDMKFVLVSFQSSSTPLDVVKVAKINKMEKVVEYIYLKFIESEFVFVKKINGKRENVSNLEVIL